MVSYMFIVVKVCAHDVIKVKVLNLLLSYALPLLVFLSLLKSTSPILLYL